MNTIPSNKYFYCFLIIAATLAMPIVGHADDGDGPPVAKVYKVKGSGEAEKKDEPAAKEEAPAQPDDAEKKAKAEEEAKNYVSNTAGYSSANMSGSDTQGYNVGGSIGVRSTGMKLEAKGSIGTGPSVASGEVSALNLRTNGYTIENSYTGAGIFNGTARIATGGGVQTSGIAALGILFQLDKSGNCALGFGPALGASYVKQNDGSDKTAAGPGVWTGGWCEKNRWVIMGSNGAYTNAYHFTGDKTKYTNPVSGEAQVYGAYRLTPGLEVGAYAKTAWDVSDSKPVFNAYEGGGMLTIRFSDGVNKESAPAKSEAK